MPSTWIVSRQRQWTIAIAVIAGLAYANALANGFTLDDQYIILDNPLVASLHGIVAAFGAPYWPNGLVGQYRPLVIASFAIDRAVGGGGAWWFHLVNVGWHVAATVLVLRLARHVLPEPGAAAAALLFAVHPVHVEAVSSIVGRCELMAAVFVLAGLLAHRAGRPSAVAWYALALCSKESGIVLLGLAACHDVLLTDGRWATLRAKRALYAGYAAVIVGYAGVLAWVFRGGKVVVVPAVTWDGATTVDRWLTMLRVVPVYLRLMVAPWDLAVDYTPRTIDLVTTVTPLVIIGVLMLVATVAVVILAWRRAPIVAAGILWFAIALSPVANVVFPSGIVLAERTLYLPSVGAVLVMGWIVAAAAAERLPRAAIAGVVLAVAGAFAVRGWVRTTAWHDDKSLVLAWLETHPESYRGHARAAIVLSRNNAWAASGREAARARALYPRDPGPYMVGSEAALALHDGPLALRLLDSAVAVAPTEGAPLVRRARMYAVLGDWSRSMADARGAYAIDSRLAGAIALQVGAAQHMGDVNAARAAFQRGLADHPRSRNLHLGYAAMLRAVGDTATAAHEDQLAAASPPSSPDIDALDTDGH
jgi:hypothetical protein